MAVESDDCSAATTNFFIFQTTVSMVPLACTAEWPESTDGVRYLHEKKGQRVLKSSGFCWWDSLFTNASKSETRLPQARLRRASL